jgi:hypothetical protein
MRVFISIFSDKKPNLGFLRLKNIDLDYNIKQINAFEYVIRADVTDEEMAYLQQMKHVRVYRDLRNHPLTNPENVV